MTDASAYNAPESTIQHIPNRNRFEAIQRLADKADSCAIRAADAAEGCDGGTAWVLLGQLGLTVRVAIKIVEALDRNAEADQ